MTKHLIISAIIMFSLSGALNAQEHIREQYLLAVGKYDNEEYFDAVTEFKRLLFFDKDKVFERSAHEYIGLSYKAGGFYTEAIGWLNKAVYFSDRSEDKYRIKTEIIKCNLLRRTYDRARQILKEMEDGGIKFVSQDTINYWYGWSYMLQAEWDTAAGYFNKISPDHELKLISERAAEKEYPVQLIKISSIILPGSGQMLTGNYFSGLLSLGWNILWGYITINSFIEDRVFDGLMTGNLLWLRFYRGNIENAVKYAEENNRQINNETLKYLQAEYKGDKP